MRSTLPFGMTVVKVIPNGSVAAALIKTAIAVTMCGAPRRIPPGSRFDPGTGALMTAGGVAECHYAEPGTLAGLFAEAGLRPSYSRLVPGSDEAGAEDLYLAVLRKTNEANGPTAGPAGRVPE